MIKQRRESHVKFSVVHEQTASGEVVSGAEFALLTAQKPGSDNFCDQHCSSHLKSYLFRDD